MKIKVSEVSIAYVEGELPQSIVEVLTEMNATMYNDDGGGQYCIENVRDAFDEDSEEYKALDDIVNQGYDYLEYS